MARYQILNLGGPLSVLQGASHENGGIPVNAQGSPTDPARAVAEAEGSESVFSGYVFSNSITNPATGNNFYKDSLKFKPSDKDDAISKKTKTMMLTRLQQAQEAERAKVLNKGMEQFMKKFGGYLPDGDEIAIGRSVWGGGGMASKMTYEDGGLLPPGGETQAMMGLNPILGSALQALNQSIYTRNQIPTRQREPESNAGFYNPTAAETPGGPFIDPTISDRINPIAMSSLPTSARTTGLAPASTNNVANLPKSGVGDLLSSISTMAGPNGQMAAAGAGAAGAINPYLAALPYAGAAFNILTGIGKRDYYKPQQNPNADRARMYMDQALDYNVQDKTQNAIQSRNAVDRSIRNMAGSRGGMINRLIGSQGQYDQAMTNILSEAARHRASVNAQRSGMELQLGEGDRAENRFAGDARLRTDAVARNMVGTGVSQIGTNAQMQRNDAIQLELLKLLYGDYAPIANLLG